MATNIPPSGNSSQPTNFCECYPTLKVTVDVVNVKSFHHLSQKYSSYGKNINKWLSQDKKYCIWYENDVTLHFELEKVSINQSYFE